MHTLWRQKVCPFRLYTCILLHHFLHPLIGLKTFLQYSLRGFNMNAFTGVGYLRAYIRGHWLQFSTLAPTQPEISGSDLSFQEEDTFSSSCFTFLHCQWVRLNQGYSAFLYEKCILICTNLLTPKLRWRKKEVRQLNSTIFSISYLH